MVTLLRVAEYFDNLSGVGNIGNSFISLLGQGQEYDNVIIITLLHQYPIYGYSVIALTRLDWTAPGKDT